MKVNVDRLTERDFFAIAVWHMMTERAKEEDFCRIFNVVPGENSEVELKLTANGVELDFNHFFDTLERQHNKMLEDTAKSLLKDKTFNMLDRLKEILQQTSDAVTEEIESTFPGRKVW